MAADQKVNIHYARIGEPTAHYNEGLVDDNGARLKTFSAIPTEFKQSWSERWQQAGMIPIQKHSSNKRIDISQNYDRSKVTISDVNN